MTILVHGALPASAVFALWPFKYRWWLVGLTFVLGAFPDVGGIVAWVNGDWTLYNTLHTPELPVWVYVICWPYTLHLIIDNIVHVPDPNWWRLYWWLEISLWVLTAILVWIGVRHASE